MTQTSTPTKTQTATRTEFWVSSGHHMTVRDETGALKVTDELLLTYLARPELVPPFDACAAERALFERLKTNPRASVTDAEIAAIKDADARENWLFMTGFRNRLIQAGTVEAAYLSLVRAGAPQTPPLFLQQLAHLILRNALDGCQDPYVLRAGELFFRPQKASVQGDALLLADLELIEALDSERRAMMETAPLTAMLGKGAHDELDIMTDETQATYWSRSDAFSMIMNIGSSPKARDGLARAVEAWVNHLTGLTSRAEPIARIEDKDWRWFIGLDAEGTRAGNALWNGETLDEPERNRVIALLRLDLGRDSRILPKVAGHPVYLILAADRDMVVRMKPQNLIAGLPFSPAS